MARETVEAETVTVTAAVLKTRITAAERDTTRAMDMMTPAANEGISALTTIIGLLGGFSRFFTLFPIAYRVRTASTSLPVNCNIIDTGKPLCLVF